MDKNYPGGDKLSLQDGSKIRKELIEKTMSYVVKRTNYYELRVRNGKNEKGKTKIETRCVYPPKNLTGAKLQVFLEEELEAFENDIEKGYKITAYSTFKEASTFWMENEAIKKLSPTTYVRYLSLLKRVYESDIGEMKLYQIGAQDLNRFYRQLSMPGANKHNGMPLSNKTIREHHNVISKVLDVAWRWGVIKENVAKRADAPSPGTVEIDCLDEEEIAIVFRELEKESEKHKTMITLLLMCGMRRGELLGLEWKDINYSRHSLSIKRTSQMVAGKLITKEPKTARSKRIISIDEYLVNLLKEYQVWYSELKAAAGDNWVNSDRLFVKENGEPMHPDSVGDWWDDFQKRIGLSHHSLHSLRHTNASIMIANNTDVATVAARLGHADATTTLKVYTYQFKLKDESAARMMGQFVKKTIYGPEKKTLEMYKL